MVSPERGGGVDLHQFFGPLPTKQQSAGADVAQTSNVDLDQ